MLHCTKGTVKCNGNTVLEQLHGKIHFPCLYSGNVFFPEKGVRSRRGRRWGGGAKKELQGQVLASQAKPTNHHYQPKEISYILFAFHGLVYLAHLLLSHRASRKLLYLSLKSQAAAWDFGNLPSATAVKGDLPSSRIHSSHCLCQILTKSAVGMVPCAAKMISSHVQSTKDITT